MKWVIFEQRCPYIKDEITDKITEHPCLAKWDYFWLFLRQYFQYTFYRFTTSGTVGIPIFGVFGIGHCELNGKNKWIKWTLTPMSKSIRKCARLCFPIFEIIGRDLRRSQIVQRGLWDVLYLDHSLLKILFIPHDILLMNDSERASKKRCLFYFFILVFFFNGCLFCEITLFYMLSLTHEMLD